MRQSVRHFRATVFAALALAAAAPAGNLLRVGPNRTYATIQAAVDAARHGDLILVDPGSYAPFDVIGRGVAILSSGPTRFTIAPSNARSALRIVGTPLGQTTTVMGFQTTVAFGAASPIEVVACDGSVRIIDAVIDPTVDLIDVPMRAVVDIDRCAAVTLYDVQIDPGTPRNGRTTNGIPAPGGTDRGICAVSVRNARVHLDRCAIRGYDNLGAPATGRWGGDGLRLLDASVARLDDAPSSYIGGAGGNFGGSAIQLIAPHPAENVLSCAVSTGAFVKGAGPSPGGFFAVNHDRGLVGSMFERIVPACLFESAGFAQAPPRMSINRTYAIRVASFFPRAYVLCLGPTAFRTFPLVQNTAYLDYASPLTIFVGGVLPAIPVARIPLTIPNSTVLIGYQFGTQCVLGPPSGQAVPALSLSLASIVVITP